jgi:hypothetical protein
VVLSEAADDVLGVVADLVALGDGHGVILAQAMEIDWVVV